MGMAAVYCNTRQNPSICARGCVNVIEKIGAGDEIRTHDPNLGKVMLYP
jgi:hypothetical protein